LTKTVNLRILVMPVNRSFENLDPQKKKRIINAALEEFSNKGYTQTATDVIVAKAEISKGALFHYFGSKRRLFIYLCDYVFKLTTEAFYEKMDMEITDFFAKYRLALNVKLQMMYEHPAMFEFLEMLVLDSSEVAVSYYKKAQWETVADARARFFNNLDMAKFKAGLDLNKTINTVIWAFDGFSNEWIEKIKVNQEPMDYQKIVAEAEEYLDFFKELFYKDEEP
jgi:TetR/AcrR family transcriptional regulator